MVRINNNRIPSYHIFYQYLISIFNVPILFTFLWKLIFHVLQNIYCRMNIPICKCQLTSIYFFPNYCYSQSLTSVLVSLICVIKHWGTGGEGREGTRMAVGEYVKCGCNICSAITKCINNAFTKHHTSNYFLSVYY